MDYPEVASVEAEVLASDITDASAYLAWRFSALYEIARAEVLAHRQREDRLRRDLLERLCEPSTTGTVEPEDEEDSDSDSDSTVDYGAPVAGRFCQ